MSIQDNFNKYLGQGKYYHDFLVFWQQEIESKGWKDVLKEHVFAGSAKADEMLGRIFAGTQYHNCLLNSVANTDQDYSILLSILVSVLSSTNRPSLPKH